MYADYTPAAPLHICGPGCWPDPPEVEECPCADDRTEDCPLHGPSDPDPENPDPTNEYEVI